jgi:hypothetical protein
MPQVVFGPSDGLQDTLESFTRYGITTAREWHHGLAGSEHRQVLGFLSKGRDIAWSN